MVNQIILLFSLLSSIVSAIAFLYYKVSLIETNYIQKIQVLEQNSIETLKNLETLRLENAILLQKNNAFLQSIVKIDKEQILTSQSPIQYNVDVYNILVFLVALACMIYAYYFVFGGFSFPLLKAYKLYALQLGNLVKNNFPVDETYTYTDSSYQYKIELNRFTNQISVLFRKQGETCEFYSLDMLINSLNTPEGMTLIGNLEDLSHII